MKKKKKVVGTVSIVVGSITFGHLFSLSLLAGFLAGKFGGGKSTGDRGRVISITIPLGKWKLHLHHWLCSVWAIALSAIIGFHLLPPPVTYGLLGGLVFQGIYCYGDWHRILVYRHRSAAQDL